MGELSFQIINAADQNRLKAVFVHDPTEIVHDIEPVFVASRFDHEKKEHSLGVLSVHETFRHPGMLRFLHFPHQGFVAVEEREGDAVGFRKQGWEGDRDTDVLVIFERFLQLPHSGVGGVAVQRTAICRCDHDFERVRAASAIDVFNSVAQLLVRLEIIEQARIDVDPGETETETDAEENHA